MKNAYRPILVLLAGLMAAGAMAGTVQPLTPGIDGVSMPLVDRSTQAPPVYPPAALRLKSEGEVAVSVVVLKDGSVGSVETLQSTTRKLGFEQAAEEAIQNWHFQPALQDGEAVDSVTVVHLRFNAPPRGYKGDGIVTGGVLPAATGAMVLSTGHSAPAAVSLAAHRSGSSAPDVRNVGAGLSDLGIRTPNPPAACGRKICAYNPQGIWNDLDAPAGIFEPITSDNYRQIRAVPRVGGVD